MNKIKTIYIGSGEFSVLPFQKLMELDYIDMVAVITQPDKPVGRKQELVPTPLRKYLISNYSNDEIVVLQPVKIRGEAEDIIKKYQPELIIVASYGQILPDVIIDSPKYGCLNLHGSLLPQLRGATPVPMAILQGLETTGVTLQKMVQAMDAGPIIKREELRIENEDNTETLMNKLSKLSVEILGTELKNYIDGQSKLIDQNESEATYCYKDDIAKEKAEIRFDTDVQLVARMIRAFYPWPIAWLTLDTGKVLKIYSAKLRIANSELRIEERKENEEESRGVILRSAESGVSKDRQIENKTKLIRDGKSLILVLQNGALELVEVQLEGKKRDTAKNYLFLAK